MSDQSDMFGGTMRQVAVEPTLSRDAERGAEPRTKPQRRAVRVSRTRPSLFDLHEPAVQEKLIEKATRGDLWAQRLFFDLQRQDRPVTVEIEDIKTAEQALAANTLVISAVGCGQLTPAEGERISSMIALQIKLLEAVDQEKRIKALEELSHEQQHQQAS